VMPSLRLSSSSCSCMFRICWKMKSS
jgi:hypothetical protein